MSTNAMFGADARSRDGRRTQIDVAADLLERLADGDREALARVTRMVTTTLRRVGAYDLGDEMRDVCQEVIWGLVRAARNGTGPQPTKIHAYVATVARNQFTTWLRKRSARPRTTEGYCDEDPRMAANDYRVGGVDDGERETRFATRQALARVSAQRRDLLYARYVEGHTIDALVSETGRSRATVNRELRSAREEFRAYIGAGRKA